MSDLHRSALHARLARLPPMPQETWEEGDDREEAADSVGDLPPMGSTPMSSRPARRTRQTSSDFSPISAAGYFDQATQVTVPDAGLDFRVYYTPPKSTDGTVMVCHHGAGWSGLTFAVFAKEVAIISKGECGVLALDCRGHGKTAVIAGSNTDETELSIETLTSDLVKLLRILFPDASTAPTFLLVGHSLGGSVIVHACPLLQEYRYRITGVAVLDVVEEFTLEALPIMTGLLDSRPDGFESPEEAIQWHLKTNAIRNPESVRISVPGNITKNLDSSSGGPEYIWRISLRSTAPYWTSWFTGLSGKFLSARTARLLVLAGTERLDKELMIGQMQGKFQLVVLGNVGHMLQEDDPSELAHTLVEFWRRNERVVAGIKKVGDA